MPSPRRESVCFGNLDALRTIPSIRLIFSNRTTYPYVRRVGHLGLIGSERGEKSRGAATLDDNGMDPNAAGKGGVQRRDQLSL